jgi:hypothetical protein
MQCGILMARGSANHSFLYKNGLSISTVTFAVIFLSLQFITGWHQHNSERLEEGMSVLTKSEYVVSGHFIQATFENWESEFLQMALYILLTVSLRQKGSAESKHLDKKEEVDREPKVHADAPWPVKKGGIWLWIYSRSLSIAFSVLFAGSIVLHFHGSIKDQNDQNRRKGKPEVGWGEYVEEPRFWFESFQNWQSEFLAVGSIVLLSIRLRQKGSPQSKPVDAPHDQTSE